MIKSSLPVLLMLSLPVELYVDAKNIGPEVLAGALARHGLTDRAVVYQSVAYLERLKSVAPALRRMPPLGNPSDIDTLAQRSPTLCL